MNESNSFNHLEDPQVILKYRKSIGIFNNLLLVIFFICVAILIASVVGYFQTRQGSQQISMSLIVNAGFFGMLAALFYSLWNFYRKSILKCEINVVNKSILYSSENKEYSLYFEDIDKVDFVTVFGVSRFLIKTKKHDVFSYSIWINGAEKILDELYEFDRGLFESLSYEEMKKKMILSSHNVNRFEHFFSKEGWLKTFSHVFLVPAALFIVLMLKQGSIEKSSNLEYYLSSLQPFIFVVMVTTGLYFAISNMLITSAALKSKNKENTKRNHTHEKLLFKKVYPWYASTLGILLLSVIVFDLNMYSVEVASKSSVEVNLIKGERFWVDKRFNCFKCNYELKVDDVIVYRNAKKNKKVFGKLVNPYPEFSRVPASIRENISKPVLIISSESGNEEYIDVKDIYGKKI